MRKQLCGGLTIAIMFSVSGIARAAGPETIYEPFDYVAGAIDGTNQNGGVGMTGAWVTTGDNQYRIVSPGLSITNLTVSGNMVQRPTISGDSELHREISAASKTALLGDNSTIWFSILMRDDSYYENHSADAFLLATGPIDNAGTKPVQMSGEGVGVCFRWGSENGNTDGLDVHGIVVDGGVTTLSTGYVRDTSPTTKDGSTYLIAGKITWAPNGSADSLHFFNILDPLADEPEDVAAFATMTADLDQSLFDTLAMATAQQGKFDEIRFATSYYEAVGRDLPPPAGTVIVIK